MNHLVVGDNLMREFSRYGIIRRTEWHYQIPVSPNHYHDIWVNRFGQLKIQLDGGRARLNSFGQLHAGLVGHKVYIPSQKLPKAMAIVEELSLATDIPEIPRHDSGVFIDAGWINGLARIALVYKKRDYLEIRSWYEQSPNSLAAEERAYIEAKKLWPDETIFTDCQTLAQRYDLIWIPREKNKTADKFGNMRKHGHQPQDRQ
jgi:hypothetical protein